MSATVYVLSHKVRCDVFIDGVFSSYERASDAASAAKLWGMEVSIRGYGVDDQWYAEMWKERATVPV